MDVNHIITNGLRGALDLKNLRPALMVLLLTVGPLFLLPSARAQTETSIFLSPADQVSPEKTAGTTVEIEVLIDDVTDLFGWQLSINYDPNVLMTIGFDLAFSPWQEAVLTGEGFATNQLIDNSAGNIFLGFTFIRQADGQLPTLTTVEPSLLGTATFQVTALTNGTVIHLETYSEDPGFGIILVDPIIGLIPYSTLDATFANLPVQCDPGISLFPTDPMMGETVELTAIPCGTPPWTFDWDFGDGTTGSGSPVTHVYQKIGTYLVALTIMDARGIISLLLHPVNVQGVDQNALFQLKVSPPSQMLGISGLALFDVSIIGLAGPSSPVMLTLSGLPAGASYVVDKNPLSPGESTIVRVFTDDNTPTGTFNFALNAKSDRLSLDQKLSLTVRKLVGVENTISLNDFNVADSGALLRACPLPVLFGPILGQCFSMQQNFRVWTNGSPRSEYWIQNVIVAGKGLDGTAYAWFTYQVWGRSGSGGDFTDLVQCNGSIVFNKCLSAADYKKITLPEQFELKSVINPEGNYVQLTSSDDEGNGNSFRVQLSGTDSHITVLYSECCQPHLDIVGAHNGEQATFDKIDGEVKTLVDLSDGNGFVDSVALGSRSSTSTGETSLNIRWTPVTGTNNRIFFAYSESANDQGVGYVPSNPTIEVATTGLTANGGISVDQTASTGVSVTITGISASDGTAITVTSNVERGQPVDTTLIFASGVGFYDVMVSGISDGTARVCITSSSVTSQATMWYWSGAEWRYASNVVTISDTVCGDIPVSALNGTPIALALPSQLSVSKFFTDSNRDPLPADDDGNPRVDVVLPNGGVRATNPGQLLAWVNIANTGGTLLNSLKLNETLPIDWVVHPDWLPARGAIHVFFVFLNGTQLEITDSSLITVTTTTQTVLLSISDMQATPSGKSLDPFESVLLQIKMNYALIGTTQLANTYPRNYTNAASAAGFIGINYEGGAATDQSSAFFTAYAKVVGDVDGNFAVDILDAALLAYSFDSRPADARFTPAADFDYNGVVDIQDAAQLAFYYGTSS